MTRKKIRKKNWKIEQIKIEDFIPKSKIIIYLFRQNLKESFTEILIKNINATDNKLFCKAVKAFVKDETVIQSKTIFLDKNLSLAGDMNIEKGFLQKSL